MTFYMTLLRTQTYSAIGLRLFLSYMMVFQLIFLPLLMVSCPQYLSVHQKLLSYDFLVTDGLQFEGLAQLNSIRCLILGPSFCPGCQMVSSHHTSTSPHRQGTWHFACSKHRVSRNDNTTHFSPGHMSMKNIKQQTLKQKKTSGSTHVGVQGMYSHKTRHELVIQSEMDNTPKRVPPLLLNKRMLTKRPEKKTAFPMQIIIYMDHDGFIICPPKVHSYINSTPKSHQR